MIEIITQRASHRSGVRRSRAGAVMATGFYEGSLTTEGTPDHVLAVSFHEERCPWSRRLAPSQLAREGDRTAEEEREATGVSEACRVGNRGKNTSTEMPTTICRSGLECRETLGPPVVPNGA